MPFINVKANIPISDSAEQAMKRQLGQAIEALPGKTEAWLMVNFEPEARLWFAGSDDAAAMVEVSAYGSVADEAADALTARVCDVIAGALGIQKTASMSNMPRRLYGVGMAQIFNLSTRVLKLFFS